MGAFASTLVVGDWEDSLIMGLRGPAPKPTATKRLEGNPGKRKLNEAEPTLAAGAPDCPDYLDDVARKEWDRLTSILIAMKVLTEADYIALANLCQAYSTLMNAQKQLNKTGILYESKSGYIQQSPLLGSSIPRPRSSTTCCASSG
jgi:P27 family predicted phage terminase small subunit